MTLVSVSSETKELILEMSSKYANAIGIYKAFIYEFVTVLGIEQINDFNFWLWYN